MPRTFCACMVLLLLPVALAQIQADSCIPPVHATLRGANSAWQPLELVGSLDDGYYVLPTRDDFHFKWLGKDYGRLGQIYFGTNGYLTFGQGETRPEAPAVPALLLGLADNIATSVTAGFETFRGENVLRLRWLGTAKLGATAATPIEVEVTFFSQQRLQVVVGMHAWAQGATAKLWGSADVTMDLHACQNCTLSMCSDDRGKDWVVQQTASSDDALYTIQRSPKKTWPEARFACQGAGGDLASPSTSGEMQLVLLNTVLPRRRENKLVYSPEDWFYIGLYQVGGYVNRQWAWVDGSRYSWSNWTSTEPSADAEKRQENVTAIWLTMGDSEAGWLDVNTTIARNYVCQAPLPSNGFTLPPPSTMPAPGAGGGSPGGSSSSSSSKGNNGIRHAALIAGVCAAVGAVIIVAAAVFVCLRYRGHLLGGKARDLGVDSKFDDLERLGSQGGGKGHPRKSSDVQTLKDSHKSSDVQALKDSRKSDMEGAKDGGRTGADDADGKSPQRDSGSLQRSLVRPVTIPVIVPITQTAHSVSIDPGQVSPVVTVLNNSGAGTGGGGGGGGVMVLTGPATASATGAGGGRSDGGGIDLVPGAMALGAGLLATSILIAAEIINAADRVVANHVRCSRITQRVKLMLPLLRRLKVALERSVPGLQDTDSLVRNIRDVYADCRTAILAWCDRPGGVVGVVRNMLRSKEFQDEFMDLQERLNHCHMDLSLALNINQALAAGALASEAPARPPSPLSKEQAQEDREADLKGLAEQLMKRGWAELTQEEQELLSDFYARNGLDLNRLLKQARKIVKAGRLQDLLISWKELSISGMVGRGGYGTVYLAHWQGHAVAVKEVAPSAMTDHVRAEMENEAYVMSTLHHPNVARFYGLVLEHPHYALVMQYYSRGNLMQLLQSDNGPRSWPKRLGLALDVARGLQYLHSRPVDAVIHGDLKTANLLLDDNLRVSLTDFGLSSLTASATTSAHSSTASSGVSIAYCAPEILANAEAPKTKESDIFALGMVLYEIAALALPFKGQSEEVISTRIAQGQRPTMADTVPPEWRSLVESCWAQEPDERPSSDQAVMRLLDLARVIDPMLLLSGTGMESGTYSGCVLNTP